MLACIEPNLRQAQGLQRGCRVAGQVSRQRRRHALVQRAADVREDARGFLAGQNTLLSDLLGSIRAVSSESRYLTRLPCMSPCGQARFASAGKIAARTHLVAFRSSFEPRIVRDIAGERGLHRRSCHVEEQRSLQGYSSSCAEQASAATEPTHVLL